jgi:hypothetical protein
MKLPIINLNGTPASILLEQQIQVIHDLRVACASLAESAPHGRDYPVEDSYWRAAREEHFARMIKVREIVREVEAIAEHCSDAVAARKSTNVREDRRLAQQAQRNRLRLS